MIRRAYIIGIVAAGLATTAVRTAPAVVSSAHSFQHYFRDLKGAGNSLSPIERFVFSLLLTNTRASEPENPLPAPNRRT